MTSEPKPGARPTLALLAAVVVVLVAAVAPLLVTWLTGPDGDGPGPPLGAVLGGSERRALDPVRLQRGPAPPAVDSAVDLADPAAVARAYLAGARAADGDDAGRTHLRAAGYAVPGSPPAAVGVLVLDPPPPGQVRTAAVTALDLVAADDADVRRGYQATVATATGRPGGITVPAVTTAYVVLTRQPDGRWLVAADTPDLLEGDD